MKTTRLCIGIISMVLFMFIMFQSCAVGIGEAITGDEGGGASSGVAVAWLMLIAGIVGVCTRKGIVGAYVAAGFYALAGIIGLSSIGSIFADLVIWGVLNIVFAIVFVLGGMLTKKAINASNQHTRDEEVS